VLWRRSGSSKTALAPLFFTKNGSSEKTFGRAPPEKPELGLVEALPNGALWYILYSLEA